MSFRLTIRDPDIHHNSWGIELRSVVDRHPIRGCFEINHRIERAAKGMDRWQPFHQGGHHGHDEVCGGWHYWEFLGLHGGQDDSSDRANRLLVVEFITVLELWLRQEQYDIV